MNRLNFGLIGNPVKHSLSPLLHGIFYRHLDIKNAEYRLFEVPPEKLEGVLLGTDAVLDTEGKVSSIDLNGFNITIPYKVKAKEILEKKFPLDMGPDPLHDSYYVKLSGAINTVKRESGGIRYFNTDASGFFSSLWNTLKFETKNKRVLVIGCGGAGRAIIAALSWKSHNIKEIYINDNSTQAIESAKRHFFEELPEPWRRHLQKILKFIPTAEVGGNIKNCDLLVNASPIGMHDGDGSAIKKDLLHKSLYVYDIVYRKDGVETQLIKDAKSITDKGCASGLDMLFYQGFNALAHWLPREVEKVTPEIMDNMKKEFEEGAKKI